MRIEPLGDLGSAPAVLRAIAYAAAAQDRPPPAALIGEWFDSGAVIAPSVVVTPVEVSEVFDVSPGAFDGAVGGGWFGYLSYPDDGIDGRGPRIPEAAGAGRTAYCARIATAAGGTKAFPVNSFQDGSPKRCRLRPYLVTA